MEIERYDPIYYEDGVWYHILDNNTVTLEFSQDVGYSFKIEKLTKEEIIEKYNIKFKSELCY